MMSDINDNRYQSLLQPIKDIASNWDIDIAESLTEYLDELDQLRISMDGGKTNLNFAEAALLIQGSTAVYSKKVEYLYSLVLKSLDFISNKKANNGNSTKQLSNNKSIDDEDYLMFDADPSFLLLDNAIEEGQNINLKSKPNTNHLKTSRNSRESSNSISSETSRVSMSLMHSILNDNQGSSSLKLSTSIIDGSGALLLCGALPSMLQHSSHSGLNNTSTTRNSFLNNSKSSPIPQPIDVSDLQYDNHQDDYDDDNGYDGGMGDTQHWNDIDCIEQHKGGVDPNEVAIIPNSNHNQMDINTPNKNTTSTKTHNPFVNKTNTTKVQVVRDMFKQLDPHQVIIGSKEVRKGKTYKIPIALLKPQDEQSKLDSLYANKHNNNMMSLLQSNTMPSKGLFDLNLMPILKLKRKLIRQARSSSIENNDLNHLHRPETDDTGIISSRFQNLNIHLQSNIHETSRVEQLWMNDNIDDDVDNNNDIHYDDNDDFIDQNGGEFEQEQQFAIPSLDHQFNDNEDYVYNEEEELARRLQNVLNEDQHKSNRNSYESICQQYINDFNRGADLFARETQLSRRVSDWTQRLEPILQKQEEEPQFDIHEYCNHVIVDVDLATQHQQEILCTEQEKENDVTNNSSIGFIDIVHGKNSVEVCRIFLACLQLTNQGNISIIPNHHSDNNNNIKSTLLMKSTKDAFDDKADPFSIHLNNPHNNNLKNNSSLIVTNNTTTSTLNDIENNQPLEFVKNGKYKKPTKKNGKVHFDSDSDIKRMNEIVM